MIKCGTLNVRGCKNKEKSLTLAKYLRDLNIDIAGLKETHATVREETYLNTFKYHMWNHGSTNARGVAIVSNFEIKHVWEDNYGRILQCEISITERTKIIVTTAYAPTSEKIIEINHFTKNLKTCLEKAENKPHIIWVT